MRLLRAFSPDPPKDLLASLVVFLVALPLCMGIAIASGLPPEKGLITGIVGGVVVGLIAGSPFQVSGPAAGLAVIVFEIVNRQGVAMLGPILLLAGLIQLVAGFGGLGRWFRAISPAVIYGMLAGIGALILIAQLHVMMDLTPQAEALANLAALPAALIGSTAGGSQTAALAIGSLTIAVMVLWDRFKPSAVRFLPGALLGVVVAATAAGLLQLDIAFIDVPASILGAVALPGGADLLGLVHGPVIVTALTVAFIASAETLLSAGAVDRMHDGPRTDYDKELRAQGVGNLICGTLGALPMTGVIVRSSTNVQAGAVSRWSAVLHGLWIALFVLMLPGVLRLVPTASLGAVLVVTGIKLIDLAAIRKLSRYGRMPLLIYAATLIGIVGVDLLTGVLVGVTLSLGEVIYKAARLRVTVEEAEGRRVEMGLEGAATFLHTPRLAAILDGLPPGAELHLRAPRLIFMDHACRELLDGWARQSAKLGGRLVSHLDAEAAERHAAAAMAERERRDGGSHNRSERAIA